MIRVSDQYVWRFLRAQKIDLDGRKSWCESHDPDFVAKTADAASCQDRGRSPGSTNPLPPSARSAPGTHAAARSSVPEAKPRAPHARPAQAGPLSHQKTYLMTN